MSVSNQQMLNWYASEVGKITYSMDDREILGAGQSGQTDCSGGMQSALIYAGAQPTIPDGDSPSVYTGDIGAYLQENGFTEVYDTPAISQFTFTLQTGDVVIFSGTTVADSAGAAGHVGMMASSSTFVSVDVTNWTAGNAVSYNEVLSYFQAIANDVPGEVQVWRNSTNDAQPQPNGNTAAPTPSGSNSNPKDPNNPSNQQNDPCSGGGIALLSIMYQQNVKPNRNFLKKVYAR